MSFLKLLYGNIENCYYEIRELSKNKKKKIVIAKLIQIATEVYYKVRQVLQNVTEAYQKVR